MAIAPSPPGAKLLLLTSASLRRLYSTAPSPSPRPSQSGSRPQSEPLGPVGFRTNRNKRHQPPNISRDASKKPPSRPAAPPKKPPSRPAAPPKKVAPNKAKASSGRTSMNIPQQARRFIYGKDNKLNTTPDTWAFLQETGIEYDNSKASTLYLGREDAARITNDFTTRVTYSPHHIMHPHDLEYLDPREHPLTETMKAKYRKMLREEPLWVIITSANAQPGLIKSIGHRRLRAAFWSAMEELGYRRIPEPGAPSIKGTLLVSIRDTAKAANSPAHVFGKAVAAALHRERLKQQHTSMSRVSGDTKRER